ncbi:MAG: AraC family transcriptional regulator [Gammaproteobacteria bacterium]|nr:AraC family transcriptional regulator [Gammaproteobacteria bacterium]
MSGQILLYTVQLVAIMSVMLLAVGNLKAAPKAPSSWVFSLMAIFVALYVVSGMSASHIEPPFRIDLSAWSLLLDTAIPAVAGLFMIYCFLEFQEQRKFPIPLMVIFVVQIVLEATLSLLGIGAVSSGFGTEPVVNDLNLGALSAGLQFLQLVFIGFAFYWTLKGWRSDLVEDRRVLRWLIISLQGGLIFTVIVVENFLLPFDTINDALAQMLLVSAIAVLLLTMLLATMQFEYVSLSKVIRKVVEPSEEPEIEEVAKLDTDSFNRVFMEKKMYTEAGLTIVSLAKKLKLPEYRLRAFIHKTLGYRNFNAMLHQYRVKDACEVLADPQNKNTPVLTIALQVGYQSITPFNNAFREIVGATPSEYRKQKISGG